MSVPNQARSRSKLSTSCQTRSGGAPIWTDRRTTSFDSTMVLTPSRSAPAGSICN
jgi:hypothetical protein